MHLVISGFLLAIGLLLAADAQPAPASDASAAAPRGSPAGGAEVRPASAKPEKPAARSFDIPLPPPPVLRTRPAATNPVQKPIPLPPPPALAAPSAAELATGELLIRQKCSKCHDGSWIPAEELSDARWRGHLKRPGVAITEDQVKLIQRALRGRRPRSATH